MRKLKSVAFALLYVMITLAAQFLFVVVLEVQAMIFGFMNGMQTVDIARMAEGFFTSSQYNIIMVALINLILIAGFGSWYCLIRTKRDVSPVPYRKIFSGKSLICTALLAVACQFACNVIMLLFEVAFPAVFKQYAKLMEGLDISVLPAGVMLFIVAVWSPLAEELVFRAMVFRTLRKGFSFVPAALLSGLAFGVYHMNWVQGVYAAALGVLLAYTYEKTNSLLGCYLFHLAFNLASYGISAVQAAVSSLPGAGLLVLLLHVVSLVGMVLLLRQFSKIYAVKKESAGETEGKEENGGTRTYENL